MTSHNTLAVLVRKQQARAEAARELQRIAGEHPELFREFAEEFMKIDRESCNLSAPPPAQNDSLGNIERTPTKAILAWMAQHHEGTASQIVAELAGQIITNSPNPATTIYSTLFSLAKRGKLRIDEGTHGERVYLLP